MASVRQGYHDGQLHEWALVNPGLFIRESEQILMTNLFFCTLAFYRLKNGSLCKWNFFCCNFVSLMSKVKPKYKNNNWRLHKNVKTLENPVFWPSDYSRWLLAWKWGITKKNTDLHQNITKGATITTGQLDNHSGFRFGLCYNGLCVSLVCWRTIIVLANEYTVDLQTTQVLRLQIMIGSTWYRIRIHTKFDGFESQPKKE